MGMLGSDILLNSGLAVPPWLTSVQSLYVKSRKTAWGWGRAKQSVGSPSG